MISIRALNPLAEKLNFSLGRGFKNWVFILVILSNSSAFFAQGYELPWYMTGLPDLVVVGTLNDVVQDVDFKQRKAHPREEGVIRYYRSAGWVYVNEVLEGDTVLERIPVIWFSRTQRHPPLPSCSTSSMREQNPPIGKPQVWVLSQPRIKDSILPEQRTFKNFSMYRVDGINDTLEKLRKGEPIKGNKAGGKIRGRYHMD